MQADSLDRGDIFSLGLSAVCLTLVCVAYPETAETFVAVSGAVAGSVILAVRAALRTVRTSRGRADRAPDHSLDVLRLSLAGVVGGGSLGTVVALLHL